MNFIENLNNKQKEAATYIEGPLLLIAGAGSGKTRVLTSRIAYLIEKGIKPYNILAITFTNKAAKEMKERIYSLIEEKDIWVGTFHSICVRILRQYINNIGYENNFTIYDTADSEQLMKECIKELNLNEKMFQPKMIVNIISRLKDDLKTPEDFKKEIKDDDIKTKNAEIYVLYQKKLKSNNAVDFDDIIFKTVELLQKNHDILEKLQNKFKFIMVDEYQDTNNAQYMLVKLLSLKYKNICVVGDDDQSIYSFRGANIKNIYNFESDFSNCKVIKLEQNYRSTKNILDAANFVIKNNRGRKEKALWTENNIGNKISYNNLENSFEESNFIIETIKENIKDNYKYNDMAILYRQNSLSRLIEEYLVKNNIPYKIIGGVKFYDRKEIKDVISYLRVINNITDDIALKRIINVPKRGIGDSTIEKLVLHGRKNNISLFETLNDLDNIKDLGNKNSKLQNFKNLIENLREFSKNNKISDLLNKVLKDSLYIEELKTENSNESINRIENINSFVDKAIDFENNSEDKGLRAFLEDISLLSDIQEDNTEKDLVTLMTIHSAKGLEFPIVFLIAFEEGIFPSYRSILSSNKEEIEEERRLCYVAITRAKNKLYITSSESRLQNGKKTYNRKSRFLEEIPSDLIDFIENNNKYEYKKELEYNFYNKNNKKFKNNKEFIFNKVNEEINSIISKKKEKENFKIGDKVKQIKYGTGIIKEINFIEDNCEVTVDFENLGIKKVMANFLRLKKD